MRKEKIVCKVSSRSDAVISLDINGSITEVETTDDVPAIFVLRNVLDIKSVKLGCGLEQCGSCAVLLDGEPILTCSKAIGDFVGRTIETIEQMQSPIQEALLQGNAIQCGYCINGIIVAAEGLFRRDSHPDRATIIRALEPHLCRCGAHPRIIRVLMELASR